MKKIGTLLIAVVALVTVLTYGFDFQFNENASGLKTLTSTTPTNIQSPNAVSGYTFSQSTGTYTPAYGGTVLCTSLCDDGYFSGITIPFTFTYNGVAYTTVSIQDNGWLQMGTTTPSGYTPICTGAYPNAIVPFARDLDGNSGVDTLRYLTTGTAPNRVFIVEWYHWGFYSGQTNQIDFQVQLYETSNIIKFVYNPQTPATTDASIGVGLLGGSTADFICRTSTTSWTTTTAGPTNCSYMTFSPTIYPPAGLTFTWTPGVPAGPPTVVTTTPVATGSSSASSGGNVTDQGSSSVTARGVCWNTAGTPTISDPHTTDGTGTGVFASYLTGLTGGTLYHVRAYATNTSGTSYGSDLTFTTCTGSAALPYNEGFETAVAPAFPCGWATTGVVATYNAPSTYNRAPRSGTNYAAFQYGTVQKWAITSGIPLTSGTTYTFSMWYVTDGLAGWTNLSAYYNTVPSATGMTAITGATVSNPTNTTYTQMTGSFTPSTTGIYYIGIGEYDTGGPWYLSFDDISVFVPSNMTFTSSTTTQNTASAAPNTTNNQIIGMQVVTSGTVSPFNISQFKMTTTGSTNPVTDIRNGKVFYTGNSATFSTAAQYGTTVTNPNGTFYVTGTQALLSGTNYFWLTYDVPSGAVVGNLIDATCDSITGSGTMGTIQPLPPNPVGARQIAGPMAGNYTIGNGMTYPNFNAAITDLNARGVAGAVTFLVKPGIFGTDVGTELDSTINISTGTVAGVSAVNTVTFKKKSDEVGDVWVERRGTSAVNDYVIGLLGAKYTTFDSINVRQKDTTLAYNMLEWGYYITNPTVTVGSQYNTIRNCQIYLKGSNANTCGIWQYYTAVPSMMTGSNSYNTYSNNTIVNAYKGVELYGYGAPSPYNLYDLGNQITGNNITGLGAGGLLSYVYGIFTYYQGNGFKILNNTISSAPNHAYYFYGIYPNYGYDANIDINGNTINANYNANYTCYGIYTYYTGALSSATVQNRVNINNNTFNINPGPLFTSSAFYGIYAYYNYADTLNISGNNFSNCNIPGSGSMYFMYPYYWGNNLNVNNNNISNITNVGTGYFYPMYLYYSNFINAKQRIYNNTINNMRSTGSYYNYGIYSSPATTTSSYIYNNTISNNFTGTGYNLYGIYNLNAANSYVYNNKIYNLKDSAYTSAIVYGIYQSSGINSYYYNNFISNLKAPASTSNNGTVGIYVGGGTYNGLYNNSIYLADTSTSTSYGSAGIFSGSTYPTDVRNNNIVNVSKPGNGVFAAKTVGLKIASSTYLTYYQNTSGNNNFYVGSDSGKAVFFDGTNRDLTIQSFRNRVSPRDQSSVTEMPNFVNAYAGDLHINPAIATQLFNGALPVTTPINITTDIDGNIRSTPFSDIGAHEFTGIFATDVTPPNILYTTLGVGNTVNRALNGVVITDPSNVDGTTNAPRVYYKKSINANTFNDNTSATDGWKYAIASNTSSPFNFTIDYSKILGGSVAAADIIQYFVVAQDLAGTPNVGINAGAFTTLPTNVNLSSANFPLTGTINQYTIAGSGIGSSITVGTGGTYPTLTGVGGLFAAINTGVLTGNVNATIISDIIEPGTNQLQNWSEQAALANYKVTIKPDGTTLRNIYGWVANGLIRLYGVNNVTIDGSFGGSGKYLKFVNRYASNTLYPTVQFTGGCTNDTLKNCIVEGNNTSTTSGVVLIGAAYTTVPLQANNNLVISGNLVSNRSDSLTGTVPAVGICNYGSAAPLPLNSNNIVINNEVKNFSYYGIYVSGTGSGDGWIVKKNSLYYLQDAYTPAYVGTTMYNVYVVPGVYGSGYTVDSNYVGGSQALAGGSFMDIWGLYNGIYCSFGFNSVSTIRGNVIKNIRSRYITASTTTFYELGGVGGWMNITGNTIGSSDTAQRIQQNGIIRCIQASSSFFAGPATVNCTNNTINNIWTRSDSTIATLTGSFNRYGIVAGGYLPVNCSNNTVMNMLSWQNPTTTAYNCFHMGILPNIYSASTISNNTIYNIANLSTVAPTGAGRILVYGMQPIGMGDGSVFSGNKISHVYSSTPSGVGDLVMGMYNAASYYGSTVNFTNNQISLLDNAGTQANVMGVIDVSGSYAGGICNWYDNSILLGGVGGAGNPYTSYAYYKSTTVGINCVTNMRNNILYNLRTGGNGFNAATGTYTGTSKPNTERYPMAFDDENNKPVIYNNNSTAGSPTFTSDYNFLVASSSNMIGDWYGTLGNMASWQTNSGGDANSVSDTVANVSASNLFRNYTNADLNIDTTKYTSLYVYKKGIGLTGITNDFNGYPRNVSGPVNIGSHEFSLNGNALSTLVSPANNAVNVTAPVTLVWTKAIFATSYNLQVSTDSTFATQLVNLTQSDSTYILSGTNPLVKYYWKVAPIYPNGRYNSYTAVWNFTMIPNIPNSIVLITPANNATNQPYTNLTFAWSKAQETMMKKDNTKGNTKGNSGKTSPLTISNYWYELSTDSTFATVATRDSLLTDTTKTVATLTSNVTYFWRVKGKNQAGWGAFTSPFKFKTTLDPTFLSQANFTSVLTPQIMSGGGSVYGSTSRLPIVIRATVSNLVPYKLYRFYNGGAIYTDLGTGAYGAGNSMYINPDSLNNRYTNGTNNLTTIGAYDVFRADGSGNCTRWFSFIGTGNATRFVVGKYVIPSIVLGDSLGVVISRFALNDSIKVVNLSPSTADTCGTGIYGISVAFPKNIVSLYDNTGGTGKPLTLTYLEDEGVTVASVAPFYTTYVNALNGRWGTVIPNNNANGVRRVEQRNKVTGALMTFNTSAAGLWPSGTNTVNPTGGLTALGLQLNDAPLLDYATLVSPANNSINQPVSLTLSWNTVTYASSYRVQLASDSAFTSIVMDSTGLAAVSLPVTGLLNNQAYWWRVAGITTTGTAPFGTAFKFTTIPNAPNVPVLLSPANTSTGNPLSLNLVWTKPALATGYNVVLATDAGFTTIVLNDSTLTDSIRTLTNLTPLTTYYWKVRAKNAGGWSSFSSAFNFKTIGTASQVTLSSPANNATGQPTSVTFVWFKAIDLTDNINIKKGNKGEVEGPLVVSNYWFELSTDSLFVTGVTRDSLLTDTTKSVTGLNTGTSYYWRVKAKNQVGWGAFSSRFKFTTLIPTLSLNLKVYLEGFWGGTTQVSDTVMVYLANSTTPYAFVDTAKVVLSGTGTASMNFNRVTTGSYYIVVNHRNHLETWSKLPQSFVGGTPLSYDFTTAATQAFGDNMKLVGSVWVLYGGDANRDGSIDALDVVFIVNQFGTQGYLQADFNGDNDVTGTDIALFVPNFGLTKIVPTVVLNPIEPKIKTKDYDMTRIDSRKVNKSESDKVNKNNGNNK